jgi:hypothetical protein
MRRPEDADRDLATIGRHQFMKYSHRIRCPTSKSA